MSSSWKLRDALLNKLGGLGTEYYILHLWLHINKICRHSFHRLYKSKRKVVSLTNEAIRKHRMTARWSRFSGRGLSTTSSRKQYYWSLHKPFASLQVLRPLKERGISNVSNQLFTCVLVATSKAYRAYKQLPNLLRGLAKQVVGNSRNQANAFTATKTFEVAFIKTSFQREREWFGCRHSYQDRNSTKNKARVLFSVGIFHSNLKLFV